MKIKKTKLQWFNYALQCDCGGEMVFNGEVRGYFPDETYGHTCTDCRLNINLDKTSYPHQKHEEVSP